MKNVNLSDKNLRLTLNESFGRPINGLATNPIDLIRAQNWAIWSWTLGNLKDCLYYLEDAEGYEFPFGTNTTQDLINQLLEHKNN